MLMDLFTLWSIVSLAVLVYVMILRDKPQPQNDHLKEAQQRVLRRREPKLIYLKKALD